MKPNWLCNTAILLGILTHSAVMAAENAWRDDPGSWSTTATGLYGNLVGERPYNPSSPPEVLRERGSLAPPRAYDSLRGYDRRPDYGRSPDRYDDYGRYGGDYNARQSPYPDQRYGRGYPDGGATRRGEGMDSWELDGYDERDYSPRARYPSEYRGSRYEYDRPWQDERSRFDEAYRGSEFERREEPTRFEAAGPDRYDRGRITRDRGAFESGRMQRDRSGRTPVYHFRGDEQRERRLSDRTDGYRFRPRSAEESRRLSDERERAARRSEPRWEGEEPAWSRDDELGYGYRYDGWMDRYDDRR